MRDTDSSEIPNAAPEQSPDAPRSNLLFFAPRSRFALDARAARKTALQEPLADVPAEAVPLPVKRAATLFPLTPKKPAL